MDHFARYRHVGNVPPRFSTCCSLSAVCDPVAVKVFDQHAAWNQQIDAEVTAIRPSSTWSVNLFHQRQIFPKVRQAVGATEEGGEMSRVNQQNIAGS